MHRLAARQWHIPRGARAASGLPQRPRQYAIPRSSSRQPLLVPRPLNSAILIPSSINAIRPDDLVGYIRPVPPTDIATDTFCVLLVTPSFASWLNDDHFLAKAIRRAYSQASMATSSLAIDVLSAVVDRLPAGAAIKPESTVYDQVMRRSTEPPVGDAGYEGVAFVTLPAAASVPSTSPRALEQGAIDFSVVGARPDETVYTETWRLPLANTVFQSGTPTTMAISEWCLTTRDNTLAMLQKTDVSHHGVNMTTAAYTSSQTVSALSVPLIPLTVPRVVDGCMGNIIRRVNGADHKPTTASAELEQVVSLFFQARGEPPQPITAWALVTPQSLSPLMLTYTSSLLSSRKEKKEKIDRSLAWERLWRLDARSGNRLVSSALAKGARLHRVLSGGGGWGKKAGLLSLDPVPTSEEIPIRMEDASSAFDGPGDFSTALTPVVHDGDAIQFFISPSSSREPNGLEKLRTLPKERTWGWELGTIPSTVDQIPGDSWQHTEVDSKEVAVFRHSFGALAEGGLTLTRRTRMNPEEPLSLLGTSRVDVPFSRLWAANVSEDSMAGIGMVPDQSLKTPVQSNLSVAAEQSRILIRKVQTVPVASTAATGHYTMIAEDVRFLRNQFEDVMYTLTERKRTLRLVETHIPEPRLETSLEPLRGLEASRSGLVRKIQGIHAVPLLLVQVPKGVRMSRLDALDASSPRLKKRSNKKDPGQTRKISHLDEEPAPPKPFRIRYERPGLIRRKGLLRVVYEQPAPIQRRRSKPPSSAPASLRARRPPRRRGGRRISEGVVRSVMQRFNITKERSATPYTRRNRAGGDSVLYARREERARLRHEMRKAEKKRLAATVGSWLGGGDESTTRERDSGATGLFGEKFGMGNSDVDGVTKSGKNRGDGR